MPCFQYRIFNIGGKSKQYFAAAADQLALLHCWSLSLEEQFYLFWPAFLFWAFRLGRIAIIISLTASVSFTLSILELSTDPQAAFFLTPFRIFEFSIGALIIFIEEKIRVSNLIAESLAIGGMLAIGGVLLNVHLNNAISRFRSPVTVRWCGSDYFRRIECPDDMLVS